MEDGGFVTIYRSCETEFTEKKSVFKTSVFTVCSDNDANELIRSVRNKYPDATHHCYGYIIRQGGIKRFSDDGEPSGTAGMPILNVIEKSGLCNTLVIVTRYFGGIKLGAGGLVRAYSTAASEALLQAGKAVYEKGSRGTVEVDYDDFSAVERMLLQSGCIIEDKSFASGVTIRLKTREDWDKLSHRVCDMCRGGAICEFAEHIYIKQQ